MISRRTPRWSRQRISKRPRGRCGSARIVDMAVFCQVSRPLPPHHRHECSCEPALSGLVVLQVRLVGDTAFERRLTLLISGVGYRPDCGSSRSWPRSRRGHVDGADVHNDFEGSPPWPRCRRPDGPDRFVRYAGGAGTSWAIAQMNPVSSRAMAVATLGSLCRARPTDETAT